MTAEQQKLALKEYLKMLRDFRDAVKAGDWRKAWAIAIAIQQIVLDLFGGIGGSIPADTFAALLAEERAEAKELLSEIESLLSGTTVEQDADSSKFGDGKIIAILLPIFRVLLPILIGL